LIMSSRRKFWKWRRSIFCWSLLTKRGNLYGIWRLPDHKISDVSDFWFGRWI